MVFILVGILFSAGLCTASFRMMFNRIGSERGATLNVIVWAALGITLMLGLILFAATAHTYKPTTIGTPAKYSLESTSSDDGRPYYLEFTPVSDECVETSDRSICNRIVADLVTDDGKSKTLVLDDYSLYVHESSGTPHVVKTRQWMFPWGLIPWGFEIDPKYEFYLPRGSVEFVVE